MVVMALIVEIMEFFGVNSLAEARDRFQNLAAADLPDPASGFSSNCRRLYLFSSVPPSQPWIVMLLLMVMT